MYPVRAPQLYDAKVGSYVSIGIVDQTGTRIQPGMHAVSWLWEGWPFNLRISLLGFWLGGEGGVWTYLVHTIRT